ncbi:MAG: hypothetical protein HUJ74_04360 [Lachnospiraceae bacterium]|nr:hypothetical protein [Lachnospiraceae bacterium]
MKNFNVIVNARDNLKVIETHVQDGGEKIRFFNLAMWPSSSKVTSRSYQIDDNDWTYINMKTVICTYANAIDMIFSREIFIQDNINVG